MANKKNYNKISTEKTAEAEPKTAKGVEDGVKAESKTAKGVEDGVKAEPKTAKGVVANCLRLNVRKKPNKTADVLTVLNANTKVVIDLDASTKTWFKLAGGEPAGYVMREFITLAD